jgi:hypothetical protein
MEVGPLQPITAHRCRKVYATLKKRLTAADAAVAIFSMWLLGGPMTSVLSVIDTCSSSQSVPAKLFVAVGNAARYQPLTAFLS